MPDLHRHLPTVIRICGWIHRIWVDRFVGPVLQMEGKSLPAGIAELSRSRRFPSRGHNHGAP